VSAAIDKIDIAKHELNRKKPCFILAARLLKGTDGFIRAAWKRGTDSPAGGF